MLLLTASNSALALSTIRGTVRSSRSVGGSTSRAINTSRTAPLKNVSSVRFGKRNAPRGVSSLAALPPLAVETISAPSLITELAFGVEETFIVVVVLGFIVYIALNFEEIQAKQKIATDKAMAEQKRSVDDAMAKQKRDIDAAMKKQERDIKGGPR